MQQIDHRLVALHTHIYCPSGLQAGSLSPWAWFTVLAGLCSSLEALRRLHFLTREPPEAALFPGSWPSSSTFRASDGGWPPSLQPALCSFFHFEGPLWAHRVTQDNLHVKVSVGTAFAAPSADVSVGNRPATWCARDPWRTRLHRAGGWVSVSRAHWLAWPTGLGARPPPINAWTPPLTMILEFLAQICYFSAHMPVRPSSPPSGSLRLGTNLSADFISPVDIPN